jgi:hypothetical protein
MKKPYTLLIAIITLCNVANAQSLTDSLLLYYPFTGNASDSSGNGFNGTVYGPILTTDKFGNPNSAYEFLGTDDYIDLPNNPVLKPQLPFSVSLWVYFNDINNVYSIFCTDYNEPEYTGCWIGLGINTSGDTVINISYGDGGTVGQLASRRTKAGTTKMLKNNWYHVITIFRGPTDMDIYINCTNDNGEYSGTGGNIYYSSYPGSIGRHNASNGIVPPSTYYLNGKVDEVRFWNRSLTTPDINALCDPCGNPLNVAINGLNATYHTNDGCVNLSGTPPGGTFYGPSVFNGYFCPSVLSPGTYNVVYAYNDINGCSGAICQSVEILHALAINEKLEINTDISVYPNPTNTKLTIEIPHMTKECTLTISNINGQECKRQQIKACKTQIDISKLVSGVYFVKVTNDKIFEVHKIIKE